MHKQSSKAAAYGSVALLIGVAAAKTLLTKLVFGDIDAPFTYSFISAMVTVLLLLPVLTLNGRVRCLTCRFCFQLLPVCIAIAVDLGLSNVAISFLPLALQQAIASTIPAATIVLETAVRQQCKPLITCTLPTRVVSLPFRL